MSAAKKTFKIDFDLNDPVDVALLEKLSTYHRTKQLVFKNALTLLFTEYPDFEPPKPHKISQKNQTALDGAARSLHFAGGGLGRMATAEMEEPDATIDDEYIEEPQDSALDLSEAQRAVLDQF